jgi:hypothetical protein
VHASKLGCLPGVDANLQQAHTMPARFETLIKGELQKRTLLRRRFKQLP